MDMKAQLEGTEPGLVAYFPFSEGYGNRTVDAATGIPAQIHGMAAWEGNNFCSGVTRFTAVSDKCTFKLPIPACGIGNFETPVAAFHSLILARLCPSNGWNWSYCADSRYTA